MLALICIEHQITLCFKKEIGRTDTWQWFWGLELGNILYSFEQFHENTSHMF